MQILHSCADAKSPKPLLSLQPGPLLLLGHSNFLPTSSSQLPCLALSKAFCDSEVLT